MPAYRGISTFTGLSAALVHLFNEEASRRSRVDSLSGAFRHYNHGNGEPMRLGPKTQKLIKNDKKMKYHERRIRTGKTSSAEGILALDLTNKAIYIGDTNVFYKTTCNEETCRTVFVHGGTYNGKDHRDGFWDVNFFTKGDDLGPKGEFEGSTPYRYQKFMWEITFPNPHAH